MKINKAQYNHLNNLVPNYFESEFMLKQYFGLFIKGKTESVDDLIDMFIAEIQFDKVLKDKGLEK